MRASGYIIKPNTNIGIDNLDIHSTLAFCGFVLCGFANSRVAPRKIIIHSDPLMDRRIETVQLEQVFEPHRMMFGELKEINKAADITMFLQRKQ